MKPETPRAIHLKDYRPPAYLIDTVALDFNLDKTRTCVRSRLSVRPNPDVRGRPGPLRLDGENFELASIALDRTLLGKKDYKLSDAGLTLLKPPAGPFTLEIVTFVDPEANKALSGLYRTTNVYCTQCEAEGFRNITYFLDRPDVLASFTVRIEADPNEAPLLLSNGNLVERGVLRRRSATSRSGTIRSRSPATCSRWSAASSPRSRPPSAPCAAARSRCASTSSTAWPSARPTRWTR